MSLVVFTGLAGILVAPGEIHPVVAVIAILCIALATGASGAVNMWYERDLDARMERTKNRPLPAGRMEPETALAYRCLACGWIGDGDGSRGKLCVAAAILALAIGFYVFVYTIWLKRRTPQNIVIGGAAGAFPPMIGWAAVTGDVSAGGIALFSLIFMWTPPHFWALALYKCDDYEKAGVPMLPVASGILETKKQILLYTVLLLPVSLVPCLIGVASFVWGALAILMGVFYSARIQGLAGQERSRATHDVSLFSALSLCSFRSANL